MANHKRQKKVIVDLHEGIMSEGHQLDRACPCNLTVQPTDKPNSFIVQHGDFGLKAG